MKLDTLIHDVETTSSAGTLDVEVAGIAIDSRRVRPGDAFVALRGTRTDGHKHVADALANGAVAVVTEEPVDAGDATAVVVSNSARALARMASHFHGDPADELVLCGVTGTNGKSSTALMLAAIGNASGPGAMGVIGTLGWGAGELEKTTHTTPDALALHAILRKLKDSGCFGVVMEVSSHAVRQHRTCGLDFSVGVLTNITHDHLDYHADWADYRDAKAEFTNSLVSRTRRRAFGTLVYWREDAAAREVGDAFVGTSVSVGLDSDADVYVDAVVADLDGTRLTLHLPGGAVLPVSMRLLGAFVATNASLAAAAAVAAGFDDDAIRKGLEGIERIPGRFEALGGGDRPTVIIDYAHTSDAFEAVLQMCRDLGARRVSTVFGCGGDRDRGKRPMMGAAAQRLSDTVFLTTDNPRTETIERIVLDIRSGMKSGDTVVVELDRAQAIRSAIDAAGPGDVVALLGKGHEDYQLVGTEKLPFSDRAEAEGALAAWSAS